MQRHTETKEPVSACDSVRLIQMMANIQRVHVQDSSFLFLKYFSARRQNAAEPKSWCAG